MQGSAFEEYAQYLFLEVSNFLSPPHENTGQNGLVIKQYLFWFQYEINLDYRA